MKLDKHSYLPLYSQLKEVIVKKIDNGEYPTGSKIPSENELCEEFGLSRPTVRQAVSELVSEGKLQIIKGKGTFVTASDLKIEIKNFTGMSYSFFKDNEIDKNSYDFYEKTENPGNDIIDAFSGTDISHGFSKIQKSFFENDVVYAFSETYIPSVFFPELIEDIEKEKSIVDITVNKYAYIPSKAECAIYSVPADSHVSEVLDISKGTFVLTAFFKFKSRSEAITEVVVLHMRSDICRIKI